jgi:hypothetical protein
MTETSEQLAWHKVLSKEELPEGRVTSVTCNNRTLCLSHHQGEYGRVVKKLIRIEISAS